MGIALLTLGLSACFGPLAKRLADKETYPIIDQYQREVLGYEREFSLEREPDELSTQVDEAGDAGIEFSTDGMKISLVDTFALAVRNSREYQSRREDLYRVALDFTEERHEFSPIFSGMISAAALREPDGAKLGTVDSSLGMSHLFASGARLTVSFGNSFTRFITGPSGESTQSTLSASIVQPLLRGGGFRVTLESLVQAERNVIYQVREFARFERGFAVDRFSEHLNLLRQLDAVDNQQVSVISRRELREQSEALAEAGRIDIFSLDRARQDELTAQNGLVNEHARFVRSLDSFKVSLGLRTELDIIPDKAELDELIEVGLVAIELSVEDAVDLALENRLDYQTDRQRVEDAERKLFIAENSLLPDLDLIGTFEIPDEGQNQPLSLDGRQREYGLRADLELPLDRKEERNAYRLALIELERRRRASEEQRDEVVREVRSSFQSLNEARLSYDIQVQSVEIAERRVDSSRLQLEAGRLTVRDVTESEDALLSARNNLTGALISYLVERLRFLLAIEGLEIDDNGMWRQAYDESMVADSEVW